MRGFGFCTRLVPLLLLVPGRSFAAAVVAPIWNSQWANPAHQIERERLLFRMTRIDAQNRGGGYFGADNCKLCGRHVPYGSNSFAGIEWPLAASHYIEFHGHKPTDEVFQAIVAKYEQIRVREQGYVDEGVMQITRRNAKKESEL